MTILQKIAQARSLSKALASATKLLSERGESNSASMATDLLTSYKSLTDDQKATFLSNLATQFNPEPAAVTIAAQNYAAKPSAKSLIELTKKALDTLNLKKQSWPERLSGGWSPETATPADKEALESLCSIYLMFVTPEKNGFISQINRLMVALGSLGLAAASLILSYSVVSRSLFNATTDWQDEAAVFCLVGVTFLRFLEKLRVFFIDLVSFAFCSFFTWKSWTLWHEAWSDGQVTSSSWGPPLAIPYGLMATGMSLLCIQLLLHTLGHLFGVTTTAAKGH
eukprot:gene2254-2292_t